MKRIGFYIVFFFSFASAKAQQHFTIRYETRTMPEIRDNNIQFFPFIMVIRDTVSFTYYPRITRKKDLMPLGSKYTPKSSYSNSASCLYIFPAGQADKPKTHHLVVDSCTKGNWTITDETKSIAGHTCKKAVGKMNGLEYTAWFAPDLPAGFAPFFLSDLPGTILEYWHEKGMSYTTAVEITRKAWDIVEPNYCKRISREEYDRSRKPR